MNPRFTSEAKVGSPIKVKGGRVMFGCLMAIASPLLLSLPSVTIF